MSTSLAYMLLFAKYHFTLDDTTPFYFITNILGILWLLRIFRRSPEKTPSLIKRFGNGYLLINVFVLLLSAMGITITGLALDTSVNHILAIFLTMSHILIFLFPLFSFMEFSGSYSEELPVKLAIHVKKFSGICVILSVLAIGTFFIGHPASSTMFTLATVFELLLAFQFSKVELAFR